MPATPRFLEAMGEVLKLFEMLGSAFSFVKRDIERKLSTIKQYSLHDVDNYGDLNDAVEYEVATDHLVTPVLEDMMSCSRTVFRLMWALKFTDLLLEGLGKAYDMDNDMDDGDRTLRWAVARAYDGALAEHHSWSIRKTVKTACLLLPGKEAFMERVGIDITRREEFISRLGASMTPLRLRMYAFYDKHDLLSLP